MPQDYTTLMNLPGFGFGAQPEPEPTVTQPSFEEEFEKSVLEQFRANSPEEIFQRKMRQYFEDLGVKSTDKPWKSRMASMGREIREAFNSSKENPYIPPKERIRKDAQKEFESLMGPIRSEANLIYQNNKADKANKTTLEKSRIAAEQQAAATASRERIAMLRQATADKVAGADILLKDERRKGMEQIRKGLENDPLYQSYTPEMKNYIAAQKFKQQYGDNWDSTLDTASDFTAAMTKPTEEKALQFMSEEDWTKYAPRKEQLERFKGMGRALGQPSWRFFTDQKVNPDGTIEIVRTAANPKNPFGGVHEVPFHPAGQTSTGSGTVEVPFVDSNGTVPVKPGNVPGGPNAPGNRTPPMAKMQPMNKQQMQVAQALDYSKGAALSAFGSMIDAVINDQAKDFAGFWAGNPAAKKLRAVFDIKGPNESMSDNFLSVAIAKHTQGMMGGGSRFAKEAIDDFKERVKTEHVNSPGTLLNAMAVLTYSIEMGELRNAKMLTDEDEDNVLFNLVKQEINSKIKMADEVRKLKIAGKPVPPNMLSIRLTPLSQLRDAAREIRSRANQPALKGDAARKALGLK